MIGWVRGRVFWRCLMWFVLGLHPRITPHSSDPTYNHSGQISDHTDLRSHLHRLRAQDVVAAPQDGFRRHVVQSADLGCEVHVEREFCACKVFCMIGVVC